LEIVTEAKLLQGEAITVS